MKRNMRLMLVCGFFLVLGSALIFDRSADATISPGTSVTEQSALRKAQASSVLPPENQNKPPVKSGLEKSRVASPVAAEPLVRLSASAQADLFAAKSWFVAPPSPPPPKPVAPPFPYVFSGAQRDGESITLFLKLGERNFIVHQGDVVGGIYRLDEIVDSVALFTYLPLNEKQQLQIGNLN